MANPAVEQSDPDEIRMADADVVSPRALAADVNQPAANGE